MFKSAGFVIVYVNLKVYSAPKYTGKGIPLQVWTGQEGSRRLKFPDFKTIGV